MEAQRSPLVAGSRNFRDLGGYATEDGRSVRWGLLFRSGSLGGVTPEGVEALRALGIRGVCDLRTSRERLAEPCRWSDELGLSYWARDYETSFGELRGLLEAEMASGEDARQAMLVGYRRLPFEQAPAYAELFRRLGAGEVPLVFNCSAGKDRAGTGAALVLTALGVPRDVVLADYVLTDSVVDLEATIAGPARPGSLLARQPPDIIRAILGCDASYIAAALDAAGAPGAGFEAYLNDRLGVSSPSIARIRDRLLN